MIAEMTPDPFPDSKRGSPEYMAWLAQRGKEMDARLNAYPLTEEEQESRLAANESIATFVPSTKPRQQVQE